MGPRPPHSPPRLCKCNSLLPIQRPGRLPGSSRRLPCLTGGEGCRPGRPPSPWAPPAPGRRGRRTGAAHPAGICASTGKPAACQTARNEARAQHPVCRQQGVWLRAAHWVPYHPGGPQHHLQLPLVELHVEEEAIQELEQSPVTQPARKQASEQPQGGHGCPQPPPRRRHPGHPSLPQFPHLGSKGGCMRQLESKSHFSVPIKQIKSFIIN